MSDIYIKLMDRKTLQNRTKQFHIDVIRLCENLPKNAAGFETAKQIIRSAGSVGANYRATVGPNQRQILFIKLNWYWRKLTNQCIGLR